MDFRKIVFVIFVTFFCFCPGVNAASKDVEVKSIKVVDSSDEVVLKSQKKISVQFNDLDQYVEYEVVLKNNTNDTFNIKDLEVYNSSDFIKYVLDEESYNKRIEPGSESKITLFVKVPENEKTAKNTNDKINLKFTLNDDNNGINSRVKIIVFIILLSIMLFLVGNITNKKVKVLALIICLFVGTSIFLFEDKKVVEIGGKISYKSQNLIETTGTAIAANTINYSNSKDVWAYYNKVKNIYIKSDNSVINKYYKKFDLTVNNKNKVIGYLVENNDKKVPYDLYIIGNGIIYANKDSTGLFSFPNVEKIEGLNNIEFGDTKIFKGMFMGDEKLSLDILGINLNNATDTSYMFYKVNAVNVKEEDLNLRNVEYKDNMFTNYLYDVVKDDAKSDKNVSFDQLATTGKYVVDLTINDKYPIYYYRGNITNNNAIFNNICWKIVRTTETGGVKLVYNGVPSDDGHCDNKSDDALIGKSVFNKGYNVLSNIGYMYGKNYASRSRYLGYQNEAYMYGNDVEWDGTNYVLKDTFSSTKWSTNYKTITEKYHYTCFNSTGKCNDVYYIVFVNSSTSAYYLLFEDGKVLDDVKDESFKNETDSEIKKMVDNWYEENMTEHTKFLEDTIWCNERSFVSGALFNENSSALDKSLFRGWQRNSVNYNPSVECINENDSFTVSDDNGNGMLTYPVGLLTADEITMAGSRGSGYSISSSYLNNVSNMWSMTPGFFNYCDNGHTLYDGYLGDRNVNNLLGVRPAISLKLGANYISGDGTVNDPYVINEKELIYSGKN